MKPKQYEDLERDFLIDFKAQGDVKSKMAETINKIIFAIGTGTLVISVTFIGYIDNVVSMPYLLLISWFFLILAVTSNVYVLWLSHNIADAKQKHILSSRALGYKKSWEELIQNDPKITKITAMALLMNFVVFFSLLSGVLFLVLFGGINLISQNKIRGYEAKRIEAQKRLVYDEAVKYINHQDGKR